MGRIQKGMIVHWDDDPKDEGIVFEEDEGTFTVLWFDAECYCDMLDDDGGTEWRVEPDRKKGEWYSEWSGMIHDKRGRFVRRGRHFVIPAGIERCGDLSRTGSNNGLELDTLVWAKQRFDDYLAREAA